jgi:hypothetical protein
MLLSILFLRSEAVKCGFYHFNEMCNLPLAKASVSNKSIDSQILKLLKKFVLLMMLFLVKITISIGRSI